jgi:cytochrome c556
LAGIDSYPADVGSMGLQEDNQFMKQVIRFAAAAVLVLTAASATADDSPIAQRKTILKGFGEATKPIAGMLKGEAPFDNAVVQKALATLVTGAKKLPTLFPDTSKTGEDTAALPKIWEDKAKFESIYAKLAADAAAAGPAITDEATLKANFGTIFGDCKSCHDNYRAKKS